MTIAELDYHAHTASLLLGVDIVTHCPFPESSATFVVSLPEDRCVIRMRQITDARDPAQAIVSRVREHWETRMDEVERRRRRRRRAE